MSSKQVPPTKEPGVGEVIGSVVAAAFGVQSRRNRERDFQRGNPVKLIAAGLAFTLLLVLGIWLAVRLALGQAGM